MTRIYSTGTGMYQPTQVITNAELVQAFNAHAELFNARHAVRIESGEVQA